MRLIDADALTLCNYDLPGMFSFRAVPEETLEAAPTIDAIEQKHGHWKSTEIKNDDMYSYLSPPSKYIHECSECGNKIENYIKKCNIKYCDACGAKMDKDG